MLLRGASAAVPTILTLQSGAALAASSNLLGTVNDAGAAIGKTGLDGRPNVQCLVLDPTMGGTPERLDLGANPLLQMQYIPQRNYYSQSNYAAADKGPGTTGYVTITDMCHKGGTYYYKSSNGPKAALSVPQGNAIQPGFLVSSTALTSFASSIAVETYF
jgi:hypothetical protein